MQKQSYSCKPWRIVLRRGAEDLTLPDSGEARKRDILPYYQQLLAVGDWDAFDTWPLTLHQQVQRILNTMPMRQALVALQQRHHSPR